MTAILLSFCSFLKLKRKSDLGWSSYTFVRKRKDQKTFDNRILLPPTANMWNCLLGEVDMCREGYIGLFWNSLAGLPTFGRNFSWEYSAYYGSLNSTFGLGMMPVSKVTYSRGNIVLLTLNSSFQMWLFGPRVEILAEPVWRHRTFPVILEKIYLLEVSHIADHIFGGILLLTIL